MNASKYYFRCFFIFNEISFEQHLNERLYQVLSVVNLACLRYTVYCRSWWITERIEGAEDNRNN